MEPAVQKRRSSGQVLILPVPNRPPEEEPKASGSRRWLWRALLYGLLVAVVLSALITTGYVVYQQQQEKRIQKELARARRMARLDTVLAYREALRILGRLEARRPADPEIALLSAEIEAFLWGRWSGEEKLRKRAERALARARRSGGDAARIAAVQGYLLLWQGRSTAAVEHAETALLSYKKSGRLGYVLGLARYHLGDLNTAEATLQLAVTHDNRFLPARVALARVRRLRGRPGPAAAILRDVLAESPRHLEAGIEQVLARLKGSGSVDRVALAKLVQRAEPHRVLHARALQALAIQALRDGEPGRVRKLLTRSVLLAPGDPDIALALTEAHLLPGGDARKAWAIQERIRELSREFRRAASVFAESALAVGRPDLAVRLLRRSRPGRTSRSAVQGARLVRIHAAYELDMPAVADSLCQGGQPERDRALRLACYAHAARFHRTDVLDRLKPQGEQETTLRQALREFANRAYDKTVVRLTPLVRKEASPWVLLLLARSLQEIGRPRAALPFLRRAVSQSAKAFRMRLELTRGLALADRRADAVRHFLALHGEKPRGARTLLDLGRLGLRLGRPDAVRAVVKFLRREDPISGHGPYLAGLLHLRGERRREARSRFEAALMRDPNHVASRIELARLAFWRGDQGGGRVLYEEAFRHAGRDPGVIVDLARQYFERNRVNRGRHAYVRAVLLYRHAGSRYLASEVMSELGHRLGRLKRYRRRAVQRILRWALRLSWRPALSHLRMGLFLERQGRIDEALAAYRRATRKGPELAGGFYHLGTLLLAAKRQNGQAAEALRRFLDLEPRGRRARNARARLKRLAARQRHLEASRRRHR